MVRRVGTAWRERTAPREDGLPNLLVVCWFPVVLGVVLACAVVLAVSGSSTGTWALLLSKQPDHRLLWGQPRPIRSDEWLAQGSWMVSQAHQGFHAVNHVFPGGMNATVFNDVPTWDWSTLFRPHLWGSLVLGLDRGLAFRWWIQYWSMLSAVYFFAVSLLPRRAVLAAVLAVAVVFQPFVQWWLFPPLTTPIVFAFTAMAATVWALRSDTRLGRVVPAALAGYTCVTMGMSIYVPFMLACGYPLAAFAVGQVLHALRSDRMSVAELLRRLVPLAAAAIAAGAVMLAWLLTRRDTIDAVLGTAYPGRRSLPVGSGTHAELVGLFSAPFDRALSLSTWIGLGSNQSTASAPYMVSLFLMVPLVWLAFTRRAGLDWPVLTLGAAQVLVLAVMFVPGWDAVARLLMADKAPGLRFRAAFVVLLGIAVVLLVQRLEHAPSRVPWLVSGLTAAWVLVTTAWVWHWLDGQHSLVVPSRYAVALTVVLAGAVVALARGWALPGVAGLCACALVVGATVNPLYRGIFDASTDSAAGRMVRQIAEKDPRAAWVGVGTTGAAMGTLFEAAVPAYSGVQTYPSRKMWGQIDPTGVRETAWNRLAHIHWVAGSGAPDPRQPAAGNQDVIEVTFDSCAAFAQRHVGYVLAEGPVLHQRCLQRLHSFPGLRIDESVYRVLKTG